MSRYRLLLLAACASLLGACTYYDNSPPYSGAPYNSYGSGYNTRAGYSDPWQVGHTDRYYRRSTGFSTFGNYNSGYSGGHGGYHHGPSCGCNSCRSKYNDHRSHGGHSSSHKSSSHKSSSSHKPSSSSHKPSSSSQKKSSSSSSHKKSSSSSNNKRSSGGSSSKSDRAKEWQKDKGGNPRAKRR